MCNIYSAVMTSRATIDASLVLSFVSTRAACRISGPANRQCSITTTISLLFRPTVRDDNACPKTVRLRRHVSWLVTPASVPLLERSYGNRTRRMVGVLLCTKTTTCLYSWSVFQCLLPHTKNWYGIFEWNKNR